MLNNAFGTHDVQNQPAALAGVNLYLIDAALRKALAREGGAAAALRHAAILARAAGTAVIKL